MNLNADVLDVDGDGEISVKDCVMVKALTPIQVYEQSGVAVLNGKFIQYKTSESDTCVGFEIQNVQNVTTPGCFTKSKRYEPLNMAGQERTSESAAFECQLRCANTLGCAFFSYYEDGGCHLQDADARQVDAPDHVTSGPMDCVTGCYQKNKRRQPLNMQGQGRTVEESARTCQERCARTEGCEFFSYWMDGGCHLQAENAQLVDDEGSVTTGPVVCPRTTQEDMDEMADPDKQCPPNTRPIQQAAPSERTTTTTGRGVGRAVTSCSAYGADWEKDGGLCYKPCKSGYKGAGPLCLRHCPDGYKDTGLHCLKASYGRGAGRPWYQVKGNKCSNRCPSG